MVTNDMTGRRFGRLAVLSQSAADRKKWLCRCDCGKQQNVLKGSLTSGNTASCGCLRREVTVKRFTTHGKSHAGSRAYVCWTKMRSRCNNPNVADFHRYGGRGIKVCERWDDFANFLADMGEPEAGATLDKKDNARGYSPDNCRWLSRDAQNRNRRDNVNLTVGMETHCLAEWARQTGISQQTLSRRVAKGWTPDAIISTPVWSRRP